MKGQSQGHQIFKIRIKKQRVVAAFCTEIQLHRDSLKFRSSVRSDLLQARPSDLRLTSGWKCTGSRVKARRQIAAPAEGDS